MFRLALALGKTIGELERDMTPQELMEWAAYYDLEPFGSPTEDHRWQTLVDLTYRVNSTGTPQDIKWFDRDPEETARVEKKARAAVTLDSQMSDYFERRIEQTP